MIDTFAPTAVHTNVTMFILITSGNLMKIKWFSTKKPLGATPPICWSVSVSFFFFAWLRVEIKHLITETPSRTKKKSWFSAVYFLSSFLLTRKIRCYRQWHHLPALPVPFTPSLPLPHKCSHTLTSLFVGVTFSPAVNHSFHLREASLFLLAADTLIASICPSPPPLNYNQGIRTKKQNKKTAQHSGEINQQALCVCGGINVWRDRWTHADLLGADCAINISWLMRSNADIYR